MSKSVISLNTQTLFQQTWRDIIKNFWYYFIFEFIAVSVFFLFLGILVDFVGAKISFMEIWNNTAQRQFFLWWFFALFFLESWIWISFIHIIIQKKKRIYKSLVFGAVHFLPFFVMGCIIDFLGLGHMVLLIIPGIVMYVYLLFAPYIYVHERLSILASIKKSMELTYGYFWPLFFYMLQLSVLFFVLFWLPYIRVLAFIFAPMMIHVFFYYVYKSFEKRQITHKAHLLTHVIISCIGFVTLGILLAYYLT